ncbi:DUF4405 domain-containing protein [Oscillochloris sp. ZM17-4]|uniref:DUF4405 domain-containing protein n=1 Tax=Oscillochloris sp. ZM17-4 TaxID=2866714 RepID=UPI001C73C52F|nr:DUF4405 domain-containing protein [Oscillochloris sp. ZM17-4]MBX0326271.1 DUF4405 domain-containing protein [Oscillochloris sp. ZM17-4]
MKQTTKRPNRNLTKLALDIGIFLSFLVAMAPRFSGMTIHEWLGVALGATITTHLLLNWSWIVQVTKRFFGKVQWSARLSYVLNALLFIDMTVIIFTGLMISKAVLPTFGLEAMHGGVWKALHSLSANLSVFLVGLHVALHWQWIVNMTKRFIIAPLTPGQATPQPARVARPTLKEEGVLQ